jgi:phospholipase C
MGYYDGNTVTAMWNYAQHYALNDHSFGTTFGPRPRAPQPDLRPDQRRRGPLRRASGVVADGQGGFTLIGDEDPTGDVCSSTSATVSMTGKNIGDLLNAAGVTWGFFEGGFNLSRHQRQRHHRAAPAPPPPAVNIPGNPLKADYIPHHQPFQYYASTANPNHIRPASTPPSARRDTGATTANHQYDILDFTAALAAGNLPAVSFLKAPGFRMATPATPIRSTSRPSSSTRSMRSSSLLLAQHRHHHRLRRLRRLVRPPHRLRQRLATTADVLNGSGVCISTTAAAALPGQLHRPRVQGRCGHGPRLPLLVISPWAKKNYIDNTVTDQASITRFIEDIFLASTRIGGGSFDSSAGT